MPGHFLNRQLVTMLVLNLLAFNVAAAHSINRVSCPSLFTFCMHGPCGNQPEPVPPGQHNGCCFGMPKQLGCTLLSSVLCFDMPNTLQY